MGLPEYRLRRLINGQLGHRNFAVFVNAYRVEAAARRLADPAEARKTIGEIAFDLGFTSLNPFNRAFKEIVGLTPTEWRRGQMLVETGKIAGRANGDETHFAHACGEATDQAPLDEGADHADEGEQVAVLLRPPAELAARPHGEGGLHAGKNEGCEKHQPDRAQQQRPADRQPECPPAVRLGRSAASGPSLGRQRFRHELPGGSMGLTSWAAFSGSDELAAVDGDFIMTAGEVQPVLRALRKAGIHVVALHNYMIGERPAFYFTHFWGKGRARTLARRQERLAVRVRHDRVRVVLGRRLEVATVEDDPVVRFVADDPDRMADAIRRRAQPLGERAKERRRVDPPARVVRAVHDHGARAGADRRVDAVEIGQELRRIERDADRLPARREGQELVEEPWR